MADKGKGILQSDVCGVGTAIGIEDERQRSMQIRSQTVYVPSVSPRAFPTMHVDGGRFHSEGGEVSRHVLRVHVRMTPEMLRAKSMLTSQYAIVVVNRDHVSPDEIINSLTADCTRVPVRGWNVSLLWGSEYMVRFPSPSDLEGRLRRPLSDQRGVVTSVRRWSDDDNYSSIRSPCVVWVLVRGFPIQCWEPSGFFDLVSSFGWLLEIDEDTRSRRKTDVARIKVGCDSLDDILPLVDVEVEGKWKRVYIIIENQLRKEGVAGLPMPIGIHQFFPATTPEVYVNEESWLPPFVDERLGIVLPAGYADCLLGKPFAPLFGRDGLGLYDENLSVSTLWSSQPSYSPAQAPPSSLSDANVQPALENMMKFMEGLAKKLAPPDVVVDVMCEEVQGMSSKRRYSEDDNNQVLSTVIDSGGSLGRGACGEGHGRSAIAKVATPMKECVTESSRIASLSSPGDCHAYESEKFVGEGSGNLLDVEDEDSDPKSE